METDYRTIGHRFTDLSKRDLPADLPELKDEPNQAEVDAETARKLREAKERKDGNK